MFSRLAKTSVGRMMTTVPKSATARTFPTTFLQPGLSPSQLPKDAARGITTTSRTVYRPERRAGMPNRQVIIQQTRTRKADDEEDTIEKVILGVASFVLECALTYFIVKFAIKKEREEHKAGK